MPGPSTGRQPHLRPLGRPRDPLAGPHPHRELLSELRESVVAGLEKALADQAVAQERVAEAASGAEGEAVDGAVRVRLDGKGLLASAEFGPEVARMTPDQLRSATLGALEDARASHGLAMPDPDALERQLEARPMAAAVMRLLGQEDDPR